METLIDGMKAIEQAQQKLSEVLRQASLVQADVFSLPAVLKADETQMKEAGYSTCHVMRTSGDEGLEEATKAYHHMYVRDGKLSTLYIKKWLGVLRFSSHENEIRSAVDKINKHKRQFEEAVKSIGDRDERFEIVHALFHGLITLAATREVHCYDDVRSVYFSWLSRMKSELISAEAAKAKIIRQRTRRLSEDKALRTQVIDEQLNRISAAKSQALRIRKPSRTRPQVSILTSEKLFGTTIGTPIITFGDKPVKITPLPDLHASKEARSNVQTYHPLVPHLHIYEKRQ